MGIKEIEPPPPGMGFDFPVWLLIPLAIMWCVWVWKQPKELDRQEGWFVPPAIITVVAFIGAIGLGL